MSQSKIYVGNLSYTAAQEDLRQLFSVCGEIEDVRIIKDRETGRSKGFAFVTFVSTDAIDSALGKNGTEFLGRQLKVSLAKENEDGGSRGGRTGGAGGAGRGAFARNKY
jgi:cold-inducible RNA-binding protein